MLTILAKTSQKKSSNRPNKNDEISPSRVAPSWSAWLMSLVGTFIIFGAAVYVEFKTHMFFVHCLMSHLSMNSFNADLQSTPWWFILMGKLGRILYGPSIRMDSSDSDAENSQATRAPSDPP